MSTNPTLAFCRTKCSTIEAPIPLAPPDTNTVRPASEGYVAMGVDIGGLCAVVADLNYFPVSGGMQCELRDA